MTVECGEKFWIQAAKNFLTIDLRAKLLVNGGPPYA